MPDKLQYPAKDMHRGRDTVDSRAREAAGQRVGEGRSAQDQWRDGQPRGVGGQEQVQR